MFLIKANILDKTLLCWTPFFSNTLQDGSHMPSMQVEAVWDRGYTGAGVKVALVDDGIETTHDDLETNFVSLKKHI